MVKCGSCVNRKTNSRGRSGFLCETKAYGEADSCANFDAKAHGEARFECEP